MKVGELFVKMGADQTQLDKDLARAEGTVHKSGTKLGDVFKGAFSVALGVGIFEAITRGFQAVVGEAVSFNSMMEQANIGFTTMLGSAEKAQAFLDKMGKFAAKTPFEYPDLLTASKRMLAMGFAADKILPTLKSVGDAAAGLGLGNEGINRITLALGQMRAKAKVSGEEMRQLTEAGVAGWDYIAEAMGKSTAEVMKLSEKGLISAEEGIEAIVAGINKDFPDMMKKMENTWEGVTSTIKDVWRMTMGAMSKGLFKSLTNWLKGVRDWATDFYNTFQEFGLREALAKSFGADFAAAINTMTAILKGFWNTTRAIIKSIAEHWAIIKPAVTGAVIAFLSFKTVTLVMNAAKRAVVGFTMATMAMKGEAIDTSGILGFAARAVQTYKLQLHLASMAGIAHVGVLQTLRTALYSVWAALGPVGWGIIAVSAALTAGIGLWGKYSAGVERANLQNALDSVSGANDNVADSSKEAAEGTEEQAKATEKAGKAAAKNLQSFDEVHQIMQDTAGAAKDVTAGLDETTMPSLEAPEAPGAISAPVPDVGKALEKMKPTLAGFWEWIKYGMVSAWNRVKDTAVGAWKTIQDKWSKASPLVKGIAGVITALLLPAFIRTGVLATVSGAKVVASFVLQGAAATKNAAIMVAQLALAGARWAWLGIQATISGAKVVAAWVAQRIKAVASITVQLAQMALVGAKWVWMGVMAMANATKMAAAWVIAMGPVAWVTALVIALAVLITAKWDWIKEKTIAIWETVSSWLSEKWEDIKAVASEIWKAIKEFFIGNWEATEKAANEIWDAIRKFFAETWQSIKNTTVEYGTSILEFLGLNWEDIKSAAKTAWEWIKKYITDPIQQAWTWLKTTWNSIAGFLENTWEEIKTTAKDIWDGIAGVVKNSINSLISAVEGGLNFVIDGLNSFIIEVNEKIRAINKVPGFSIPIINPLDNFKLPRLAAGGIVKQPTTALIGESGPEAVIPLNRSGFVNDMADTIAQSVYKAIIDAFRIAQATAQQDDKELVLKIDNAILARMQLPAIIKEGQRQGLDLVVQPQGG